MTEAAKSPLEPLASQVFERITIAHTQKTSPVSLGLPALDPWVSSWGLPWFLVVVGVPGSGRSVLASQLLTSNRPGQQIFYSIDLSPQMLLMRMMAAHTRVPLIRILLGRMKERDFEQLAHAAGMFTEGTLAIEDAYAMSVQGIIDDARRKAQAGPIGAIAVDGLELLVGENVDSALMRLRALSRELSCTVVVTLPLDSRLPLQRINRRPLVSDLATSSVAGTAADTIIGLHRSEMWDSEAADRGTIELIVMKQKNGDVGTVKMRFDASCLRIDNLTPEGA